MEMLLILYQMFDTILKINFISLDLWSIEKSPDISQTLYGRAFDIA